MKHCIPPRQSLGFFPTPLHELAQLRKTLGGPQLFIKRDDLTGLGLGGNKTRKLEYIVGAALAENADTLITAGAIQSNHCRQTAAAAAKMHLQCHLVLGGAAPDVATGNLLLDQLFGAQIHWAGEKRKGEDLPALADQLRAAGRRPFVVPYGGSCETGAYGFVEAFFELDRQTEASGSDFTHIVFASSSGGTHAGLMLGKKLLKKNCQLMGIRIDKESNIGMPFDRQILDLAEATARFIDADCQFTATDLILNPDYTGAGYAEIGAAEKEAISLLARNEGILVDPVYTGRALAGLIDLVRSGYFTTTDRVLFWHTGGAPALFAYAADLQKV